MYGGLYGGLYGGVGDEGRDGGPEYGLDGGERYVGGDLIIDFIIDGWIDIADDCLTGLGFFVFGDDSGMTDVLLIPFRELTDDIPRDAIAGTNDGVCFPSNGWVYLPLVNMSSFVGLAATLIPFVSPYLNCLIALPNSPASLYFAIFSGLP